MRMLPLKNLLHPKKLHHHHHHEATDPTNLVHGIHDHLLLFHNSNNVKALNQHKLKKLLQELRLVLYGDSETLPDSKACYKIAMEFFKDKHSTSNPFRLLIKCFSFLEYESQTLTCQIVSNLMAQHIPSSSQFIASEFLEQNMDLVDFLLTNTFHLVESNSHVALLYGVMLRECVQRSQIATNHVLHSQHCIKKLLQYTTLPNYTFASHVEDTLGLLLTRHKSSVAEFLSRNYEWFFEDFNSKLLASSNQLTKSKALTLLGNVLSEGQNRSVMQRYVSNVENLKVVMNALRESKRVQLKGFQVFKLFVFNSEKPKGVVGILRLNKIKLLQLMDELKPSRESQQFDEDKARVIAEINMLDQQVNVVV